MKHSWCIHGGGVCSRFRTPLDLIWDKLLYLLRVRVGVMLTLQYMQYTPCMYSRERVRLCTEWLMERQELWGRGSTKSGGLPCIELSQNTRTILIQYEYGRGLYIFGTEWYTCSSHKTRQAIHVVSPTKRVAVEGARIKYDATSTAVCT